MSGSSHLDVTMGALCALGGIVGFAKAKSLPSLIAGLGFGGAYIYSGYLIKEVDGFKGHASGFATSVVLTGIMGARFYRTRKFMPAGLLSAAGAAAMLYHGYKLPEWAP